MNGARSSRSFAFDPAESQTTGSALARHAKLRKNGSQPLPSVGQAAPSFLILLLGSSLCAQKILGWDNSSKATAVCFWTPRGSRGGSHCSGSGGLKRRSSRSETAPEKLALHSWGENRSGFSFLLPQKGTEAKSQIFNTGTMSPQFTPHLEVHLANPLLHSKPAFLPQRNERLAKQLLNAELIKMCLHHPICWQ